jgi:integrase/recombinase XerC/integrase/recombinase XerD
MATLHHLAPPERAPLLGAATAAFLGTLANPNTAKAYATALRALTAELGASGQGRHRRP